MICGLQGAGVTMLLIIAACQPLTDPPPWLARLHIDGRPVCYGTVVGEAWVITARHCVQVEVSPRLHDLGRLTLVFDDDTVSVEAIYIPVSRNTGISDFRGSDAALVRLSTTRKEGVSIARAAAADRGVVVVSERANAARTLVVIHAVRDNTIFTEGVTRPGQSGSPLLSEEGELIGIASWRSGMGARGALAAFTAVTDLRQWIDCVRSADLHVNRRECSS